MGWASKHLKNGGENTDWARNTTEFKSWMYAERINCHELSAAVSSDLAPRSDLFFYTITLPAPLTGAALLTRASSQPASSSAEVIGKCSAVRWRACRELFTLMFNELHSGPLYIHPSPLLAQKSFQNAVWAPSLLIQWFNNENANSFSQPGSFELWIPTDWRKIKTP